MPEHVAVVSSIMHRNDPAFHVSEHYFWAFPQSQYFLFHICAAAAGTLVRDPLLGTKLALAVAGLAYPFSLRALLTSLRADPRLAVFGALVFWNRTLTIGFLPFVAAVPLMVYALAVLVRCHHTARLAPRVGLAALAVLLFYMHIACFALFVAVSISLTLVINLKAAPGTHLRSLVRLAWLLPSACCLGIWLRALRLGGLREQAASTQEFNYLPVKESLAALPIWAHDIWPTHLDEFCACIWWLSFLAIAIASLRQSQARSHALLIAATPLVTATLLYFATPYHLGVGYMLNVRYAPALALFAILPLQPQGWRWTRIPVTLAGVASLLMSALACHEIEDAQQAEVGELDAVLSHADPSSRMLSLSFDPKSDYGNFAPWLHVVAYHRIQYGGITSLSFSSLPHWPLQFKKESAPPAHDDLFSVDDPCVFRNQIDGAYFDYVLVRGSLNPFRDKPPGPQFEAVASTRKFTLYARNEKPAWPAWPKPDRGPCVRRSAYAEAAP